MTTRDLSVYFHRHCRLRLRSGKEVFGVLWEDESNLNELYFASHGEHKAWRRAIAMKQAIQAQQVAQVVHPEDIIAVESL